MNAFSSLSGLSHRRRVRPERVRVSIEAAIVTMSAYQFPELADLSPGGAKLKGETLPVRGVTALLRAGGLEVLCRVVWVRDGYCGVRFEEIVAPKVLKQLQLKAAVSLEPLNKAEPSQESAAAGGQAALEPDSHATETVAKRP